MIHDREMRALFSAESEEHLQHLDEGLLRLERDPDNHAVLEEVFRHAHSLKGAARMLGLGDVEALAHTFEDALGAAARGREALSSERVEQLLGGLDAMRSLVRQATADAPSTVDLQSTLAALRVEPRTFETTSLSETAISVHHPTESDSVALADSLESPPREIPAPVLASTRASSEMSIRPSPEAAPAVAWSIETMRVEPEKLDSLLAMAGELVVSTTRAVRGKAELQSLSDLREEWVRAASASRRALREIAVDSPDSTAVRELERLVKREGERLEMLGRLLDRLGVSSGDLDRLGRVVAEMEEAIRGVRLLPLSTVFGVFPRPVRDMSRSSGKPVRLLVEGGETHADKRILESLKDPLMHLIRNSIDHGLEAPSERALANKPATATLRLRGFQTAHRVIVEVEDDGRGLDVEAIRRSAARKGLKSEAELAALPAREVQELIFASGFSTRSQVSELSGRGVGLDIVRANVQRLRGTVEVESRPGQGCLFRLSLPVTLATTRVLLVRTCGQLFAVPIESVRGIHLVKAGDIFRFQGRETVSWSGRPTSLARLGDLLQLAPSKSVDEKPCLLIESGDGRVGLLVDELLEEQEIILKPPGALGDRVPSLAGATILETGEVCLVLHPGELLHLATSRDVNALTPAAPEEQRPKSVLLVEDSITTRTQEKRILESAGFEVVTAVDGLDGWNKLAARPFDAVVSDIEMPRLDGFSLAARIRQNSHFAEMPIILVTSLASEEDRQRGVEVGANAYIVKGAFDQRELLDALRRLA